VVHNTAGTFLKSQEFEAQGQLRVMVSTTLQGIQLGGGGKSPSWFMIGK
jgi:hypothetical protein